MDYYKILGVEKQSTTDDIKKAYRKLAHKYHPDKPGGDANKFKEINEAYQILSNPQKKAQYDKFGRVFDGKAREDREIRSAVSAKVIRSDSISISITLAATAISATSLRISWRVSA